MDQGRPPLSQRTTGGAVSRSTSSSRPRHQNMHSPPKSWRCTISSREPPPPTIYIRGALQALLRAHPRRSLVIDCDEPSPVINVEEDAPPSRPASGDQAGPTDEREDPCSYTAGDITIKSRLLCAREREYQHLDDDSSASQRETGAGSSTDKPRPRQTSGDKPRPDSTNAEIAPTSATDPDTEQIIVLPSGKAYQKPKPVPKGRSKLPDRASAQPMEAGVTGRGCDCGPQDGA